MADDREQVQSGLERVARQLAAEALEDATQKARAILTERLTETLVAAGQRSLTAQQPAPPPENAPAKPPANGAVGCYLFAIAAAGAAPLPSLRGMASEPVRELVSGGLAALVCEIPLGLFDGIEQEPVGPESRLAELARRHDEVVRAAFQRGPVLPLRFGTVLPSEGQLLGVLEEEQAELLEELRRLEGRAEWTCRIQPRPAAASAAARSAGPRATGASYLAQRERELTAAQAEPHGASVVAQRVSQAVEADVESALPPDAAGEESRVTFLVRAEAQERFAGAVAAVAEDSPAHRIELLGPYPPYHFAEVQLGRDGG